MNSHPEITVSPVSHYIAEQSQPEHNQYLFAYTITITNTGSIGAQLLQRKWFITDANNKLQEVYGEGVVGEKPHLQPGESFVYTSSALLETPVGHMEGYYEMIADNGETFQATIPLFRLTLPHIIN